MVICSLEPFAQLPTCARGRVVGPRALLGAEALGVAAEDVAPVAVVREHAADPGADRGPRGLDQEALGILLYNSIKRNGGSRGLILYDEVGDIEIRFLVA